MWSRAVGPSPNFAVTIFADCCTACFTAGRQRIEMMECGLDASGNAVPPVTQLAGAFSAHQCCTQ